MTNNHELGVQVGVLVRTKREARGWTRRELSFATGAPPEGLSEGGIGAIERGERSPNLGTIYQLAEALECEPTELLPILDGERPPTGIADMR